MRLTSAADLTFVGPCASPPAAPITSLLEWQPLSHHSDAKLRRPTISSAGQQGKLAVPGKKQPADASPVLVSRSGSMRCVYRRRCPASGLWRVAQSPVVCRADHVLPFSLPLAALDGRHACCIIPRLSSDFESDKSEDSTGTRPRMVGLVPRRIKLCQPALAHRSFLRPTSLRRAPLSLFFRCLCASTLFIHSPYLQPRRCRDAQRAVLDLTTYL